jgi:pyruvate dehydrogenase E2 component (dihydrolipoamide acetyltransferase)
MATEIVMPRQGQSVEACTIVRWLKQPGENIGTGDVLCEIETDKAAFEVESTATGTLLAQFVPEGEEVAVLAPIAAVGEPGEEAPAPTAPGAAGAATGSTAAPPASGAAPGAPAGAPPPAPPAAPAPAADAASFAGQVGGAQAPAGAVAASARRGGPASSPRARRRAAELGVDRTALSGSGPRGRIIERDVVAAAAARPALTAAARAAAAAGSPVPAVGSGIGGRVTLADLAGAATPAAAVPEAAAPEQVAPEQVESIPVKGVRKLISERMRQSLLDTAQLTMHATADAEALVAYRARLKASAEQLQLRQVTINDLILFAVARTLPRFPELNAVVRGDGAGDRIERHRDVHLAFAVDTERGLVVPVIAGADRLSIAGLAGRAHELAAATQAGSISPDLLQGGTFTVTNLGALGVESFTPILNLPQVAILGVGALVLKPVLADLAQPGTPQQVGYRRHLGLSLTIDHRVVDGAPAARFLQALAAAIADIDLLAAL